VRTRLPLAAILVSILVASCGGRSGLTVSIASETVPMVLGSTTEGTARSTSHGDAFPQNVPLTTVHGSKFVGSFVVMQAEETHLFDLRAVPD